MIEETKDENKNYLILKNNISDFKHGSVNFKSILRNYVEVNLDNFTLH